MFTLESCHEMQCFAYKEVKRELAFGKLVLEYLTGHLSAELTLTHQIRGESIIDIRLQVKVGPIMKVARMHACIFSHACMLICNEPVKHCVSALLKANCNAQYNAD